MLLFFSHFLATCSGQGMYTCVVNPYDCACKVKCIQVSQVCDGAAQCPFGDDEVNCQFEGICKFLVWKRTMKSRDKQIIYGCRYFRHILI